MVLWWAASWRRKTTKPELLLVYNRLSIFEVAHAADDHLIPPMQAFGDQQVGMVHFEDADPGFSRLAVFEQKDRTVTAAGGEQGVDRQAEDLLGGFGLYIYRADEAGEETFACGQYFHFYFVGIGVGVAILATSRTSPVK